jgi:hypothetical protein
MERTSELRIRRIFANENSTKNQVTVQFAQRTQGGGNPLLALTQGINLEGTLTALVSFDADQCQKLFGTTKFDAKDVNNFETFMDVSGTPFASFTISVEENTTQNPANPNQTAKINPKTEQILTYGGKPIYRHTELALKGTEKTILLVADSVPAPAAAPVDAMDAGGQKVI